MLTDILIDLLNQFLSWICSVRPAWNVTLPPQITQVVQEAMAFNSMFPVVEIFSVISTLILLVLAMQTWKWSQWVVERITDILP